MGLHRRDKEICVSEPLLHCLFSSLSLSLSLCMCVWTDSCVSRILAFILCKLNYSIVRQSAKWSLGASKSGGEIVEHVGSLDGTGMKVGVVIARFNDLITRPLLDGAVDTFQRYGVKATDIEVSEWREGRVRALVTNTESKLQRGKDRERERKRT